QHGDETAGYGNHIADEYAILRPAGETGAPFARRRHFVLTFLSRLQDAAEDFLFHRAPGAQSDAGQGIVRNRHRQAGFVAQHLVEALQQGAAAGEHDALVDNVGGQLRRRILERDTHALDDRADRFGQCLRDLLLVDRDLLGDAVDQVAALDVNGLAVGAARLGLGDANLLLDPLGRGLADHQILVTADIGADRLVHLVAADAN